MRAPFLALLLTLPALAGCLAIDDVASTTRFPHGTDLTGLTCPDPVAAVQGPQVPVGSGALAPHAMEFSGSAPCILWRGGVVEADVAAFAVERLDAFRDARIRFVAVHGAWTGVDGRTRAYAGDDVTISASSLRLPYAGPVRIERGDIGGSNGTFLVVEMPAAENDVVGEGGATRAPVNLTLRATLALHDVVLDGLGRGKLEIRSARGLALAGARIVAVTQEIEVEGAGVAWTLGVNGGWRIGELPIQGDLQTVGLTQIASLGRDVAVDSTASEAHHARGSLLETSVTLAPVEAATPHFTVERERATAVWLAAREVSAVGQAYGVRVDVAAADPALKASTGHWFDDPEITLLDVPELVIRNLLNAATLFFLDDALRTTTIPPGSTRYVPLYLNATAPPGDYTVDVGIVNPSGKPATTRVTIRVQG